MTFRAAQPRDRIGADFQLSNIALRTERQLLPERWQDGNKKIGQAIAADCLALLEAAESVDHAAERRVLDSVLIGAV